MGRPVTIRHAVIQSVKADGPSPPGAPSMERGGAFTLIVRDVAPIEGLLHAKGEGGMLQRVALWDETDDGSGVLSNLADAYEKVCDERDALAAEVATLKEQMRAARRSAKSALLDLALPGEDIS